MRPVVFIIFWQLFSLIFSNARIFEFDKRLCLKPPWFNIFMCSKRYHILWSHNKLTLSKISSLVYVGYLWNIYRRFVQIIFFKATLYQVPTSSSVPNISEWILTCNYKTYEDGCNILSKLFASTIPLLMWHILSPSVFINYWSG